MIPRSLLDEFVDRPRNCRKIVVLYGARQTGKTTPVEEVLRRLQYRALSINADELLRYSDVLSSRSYEALKGLCRGAGWGPAGYEIKSGGGKASVPETWIRTYPQASCWLVTLRSYLAFLTPGTN